MMNYNKVSGTKRKHSKRQQIRNILASMFKSSFL